MELKHLTSTVGEYTQQIVQARIVYKISFWLFFSRIGQSSDDMCEGGGEYELKRSRLPYIWQFIWQISCHGESVHFDFHLTALENLD